MDLHYSSSRALRSISPSPSSLGPLECADPSDSRQVCGIDSSPLTASSLASPLLSDSRCSSPNHCEPPRSPLKFSDSVLPMSSLPSFDFSSSGAYATTYHSVHLGLATDGAIALPPSFSATRHAEGLTSPSPAQSFSSQDTFSSPFSAISPFAAGPVPHADYRHRHASSQPSAYPPSSPSESSHSHASLLAERDMEALYAWARPSADPRAHKPQFDAEPSTQFAEHLSLKGAFVQSLQPLSRSLAVTVSSAAGMDRPTSFRTPSTSSTHSLDSALEAPESLGPVPAFVHRNLPTFPMPMPVTASSALQLPYATRQPEVAYSQHMQWILPTPPMARTQSDPIAYQPSPAHGLAAQVSSLPSYLSHSQSQSGPRHQPSVTSLPALRGPTASMSPPAVSASPFLDRVSGDLLVAPGPSPARASSKRASPALDRSEPCALSAPTSRAGSPTFEDADDLSPTKRARTRPSIASAAHTADLRVSVVKAEPMDPSPSARTASRMSARVSPTSSKLPRSRSSTFSLSLSRPSSSPSAKDHVRHQGVEKQRRDRTRQLFDALQDFTAARVMGPDDLRAPAEAADPFVSAPTDQPRFSKVQRKGIKLPKEHTLTDALNVLQRQEHELAHYRTLTAALTGPDAALAQRARALLAAPAEQVALCSGCGGSLEVCRLDQALRESSSPAGSDARKGARPVRPRGLPQ